MPASLNKFVPDALLAFSSDLSPLTLSATGVTPVLTFPATPNAPYWPASQNTMPEEFAVVIDLTAISGTSAAVVFTVEASATGLFGDTVTVATLASMSAVGSHVIGLVKSELEKALPAITAFRVRATISGTTPSITFDARINPFVHL